MKHIILLILLTLGVLADNASPSNVDKNQTWARIIIDQFLDDGNRLRAFYYSYPSNNYKGKRKIYDNIWNLKTGILESSEKYELNEGENEQILHKHESCYLKNSVEDRQALSIYNKNNQKIASLVLPIDNFVVGKNFDCSYLLARNFKNGMDDVYLVKTDTGIFNKIFTEDTNTDTHISYETFLMMQKPTYLIANIKSNGHWTMVKIDLKTFEMTSFENSSNIHRIFAIPNSPKFITESILEDDTVEYKVWDSISNRVVFTFISNQKAVTVKKKDWKLIKEADNIWDISNDGSEFITKNKIIDGDIVKRWDINTGQLIATYSTMVNRDFDLSDNKKLAAASNQSYIELLDANTTKSIAKLYFKTDETWSYEKQEMLEKTSNFK